MRTFLLVLIATLTCTAYAQEQPLQIQHLKGNCYVYTTWQKYKGEPVPSNSMYIVTDAGVVMIDVPWDSTQTLPLLDSIRIRHGKKVVLCIATHHHGDRTGSFDVLQQQGIATWSSKETLRLCKENKEKQAQFFFVNDTTFTVGQTTIETYYPGSGHTIDNIVIWIGSEKVLYGGCFVKSIEAEDLGYIAEADLRQWPLSIKRVQQKYADAVFVIPGHEAWSDKRALDHTLKLLKKNK